MVLYVGLYTVHNMLSSNDLHIILLTLMHHLIITMAMAGTGFLANESTNQNRRHSSNTHLERATISKGVSKQNSHPL